MITHPILSDLAKHGVRMGLRNLEDFLAHLQITKDHFGFVIHVGGTNGKGSVCRMLEAIYRDAGYSVGLYTSPHLEQVNERIRLNGESIGDAALSALLGKTQKESIEWFHQDQASFSQDVPLTYFEMMTAVAIQYFAEHNVEVLILEVGLGGRLDATNLFDTSVSAIVSIAYDHMDVLGSDIGSIATEKSGIIKVGQDVVVGMLPEEGSRIIRFIAEDKEARLHQLGLDFHVSFDDTGAHFQSEKFRLENVQVGLLGAHQVQNAAVALQIVHTQQHLRAVSISSILRGLTNVSHPGRLQWVGTNLLVDAAHNPAGAQKLADYILQVKQERKLPITLLLGVSEDKDLRGIGVILSQVVDRIFATQCSHPRAKSSSEIVKELKVDVPVHDMGSVETALQHCRWDEEIVVVAGSIFLVGAVQSILNSSDHYKPDFD